MAKVKKEVKGGNEVLRKLILTRIKKLKKQKFNEKAIDKFSVTFRVFMLRYLNLNYEFTVDELIIELNKTKIPQNLKEKVVSVLKLISEVKYENKEISKDEFKSLLNETNTIVNLATGITIQEKKSEKKVEIVHKKIPLFDLLHKIGIVHTEKEKEALKKKKQEQERIKLIEIEKNEIIEKKKIKLEKIKEEKERKKLEKLRKDEKALKVLVREKRDNAILIKEMIKEVRKMIAESSLDDAKIIYMEIMKIYNTSEPEEKAKVYADIKSLYHERKIKEEQGINKHKLIISH
tara:strand:+ start:2080 stop:2952 length:873 start_codon:yes stop_codon:yes gene_type:complete